MFLAFFPFSEIVCLVSVIMAWLYIGLGIIGNHQIADTSEGKSFLLGSKVQSVTSSVFEAENCFWFTNKIVSYTDTKLITSYKAFIPVISQKNIEYEISLKLIRLISYKPNRAPPAIS